MQYSFIMGDNFSVFAKTESCVANDELMRVIKKQEPDIQFAVDRRLQCVFPISEQEYIDRNQKAVVVRISENLDRLLLESATNNRTVS